MRETASQYSRSIKMCFQLTFSKQHEPRLIVRGGYSAQAMISFDRSQAMKLQLPEFPGRRQAVPRKHFQTHWRQNVSPERDLVR